MSTSLNSELLSSDEEVITSDSSGDLTVEDSSGSGNESIQTRGLKRRIRRPAAIISDSDDEDWEGRALSPGTRLSITGVRPADLSDGSSEIEYSSDDEVNQNNSHGTSDSKEEPENSKNSNSSKISENGVSAAQSQSFVQSSVTKDEHRDLETETVAAVASVKHSESIPYAAQYSKMFEHSIKDQMSSTTYQESPLSSTAGLDESNDVVALVNLSESVVCLSSDDNSSASDAFAGAAFEHNELRKKQIQPKITAALSQTIQNVAGNRLVSKEFFEKEVKKCNELKAELLNAESLLEKLKHSLYDGGKQLSLRVDSLRSCVKKKEEEILKLVVLDHTVSEKAGIKKFNGVPNWDDLSEAVNQIKPDFTGKKGLNTFNSQKVLTLETLKDLHGSLETCPGEDVLSEDPKGLRVTLMDHQKHALAWMNWRENQKPRGGILADDMGLGKTLTMISLVLASKIREEDNDSQNSDDSDIADKNGNQGWTSKNRRDYYKGGTLVICPASLMRQWESEVENKLARHRLSVCVHHGNSRDTKPRHLATYDIVITTYNIVSREAKSNGALFSINWKRLILDEAHIVRNHKSQSSTAVCELRGKYRWVLTGTPIQNKEMDMYALLKFLKCTPFDDLTHWKKWIDNKSAGGLQRLNTLMKSLMLRRTKVQLQQGGLMSLPERKSRLIEVNLDKDEMNVYQKIMTYSKTLFAQFLYQRAEKNNDLYFSDQGSRPTFMQTKDPNGAFHKMHEKFSRMHHGGKEIKSHEILVLLLRLRQICCHPGLIDAMLEDENEHILSDSENVEIDLLDQLNNLAITDSSGPNSLHFDNVDNDDREGAICKASARVLQRSNPVFDLSRPSSKMVKVLDVVEKEIINTPDKGIIISQWTSILNILKNHLDSKGVRTLSLNGSVAVKNRQSIITEFNDPKTKPKILLLSLTAGGVGLNLVGANHLLLIDLHWNPQLESQAQDRIYRVGQKKPVHIYKFMCKDTVEERIKALQDQKLDIANNLLTGSKGSEGSKLSIDDLKGLFGL